MLVLHERTILLPLFPRAGGCVPVGDCPILTERAVFFLEIWIAEPRLSNSIEQLKEGREQRSSVVPGKGGGDAEHRRPTHRTTARIRKPSERRYPDFLNWGRQAANFGIGSGRKASWFFHALDRTASGSRVYQSFAYPFRYLW